MSAFNEKVCENYIAGSTEEDTCQIATALVLIKWVKAGYRGLYFHQYLFLALGTGFV